MLKPKKKTKKGKKGEYISRVYENFEPLQRLGRGAFGVVWSARSLESPSPGARYAVKRTFPRDNSDGFEDLRETEKELQALSQLRGGGGHPNVVEIYTAVVEKPPSGWVEEHDPLYKSWLIGSDGKPDMEMLDSCASGVDEGKICPITIVQQLCAEGSLEDWLKSRNENHGQGDLDLLLDFSTQLADGLRFLHFRDIIHRDLKPENIFLTKKLGKIRLKLGDFGLSKFVERLPPLFVGVGGRDHDFSADDNALTQAEIGTPLYRSPEQDAGGTYGFKVDVYALGLILVAVFLQHPAKSAQIQLKKYFLGEAGVLPELYNIPPEVRHLILEMISKDPEQRPTASDVHYRLLRIWQKNLSLPIQNFDDELKRQPHITGNQKFLLMNRPELDQLLNVYEKGIENLVFLEGEAGTGKTTLALQFAQRISRQGGGESIILIDANYHVAIKNKLEWLSNLVRANAYQNSGHRVSISDMVRGIQQGFRAQKWILILDDFQFSSTEHAVLLNLLSLKGVNKPFLVVCTRAVNYFQKILDRRQDYAAERDFSEEIFKIARLMQRAWQDVPEDVNHHEILLHNGYSSEKWLGLEILNLILKSPISQIHQTLGDYLDWNPLALKIAGSTIAAHESLASLGLQDSNPLLIRDTEEYIVLFLQLCEEFEGNPDKVPVFHRFPEQITSNYTDRFVLRIVLHLTMCQIETALTGRDDLLATLNHIQMYLIMWEDETIIPDSVNRGLSISTSVEVTTTTWSILVLYGLVREWTDVDGRLKHSHICGNHCLDFIFNESEEFDEEFDFSSKKKKLGGYDRYGV